jgi:hypothetical protein
MNMIKQNVSIVNFKTLYVILDEIKDNLPFNIINYDTEKIFLERKKNNLDDSLVIKSSNNTNLIKRNLLIFNNLPISLHKLIELINIHLIKLKFNLQSKINIQSYELNLNTKIFSKKNINLKLTEKEIQIILYLSKKKKNDVLDLQKNIWGYSPDIETHTVETHIYRLRKKINDKFNDKNFIITLNHGYYIK